MDSEKKQKLIMQSAVYGGLVLTAIALSMAVFAGFGSKWDWWHFREGFIMLKRAVYIAIPGFLVSLAGLIYLIRGDKKLLYLPASALVVSIFVIAVPFNYATKLKNAPLINDITTDLYDPPLFETLGPIRYGATNSSEYSGHTSQGLVQREHYREVKPLVLELPKAQVFDIVRDVSEDMCWDIVHASRVEGTLEATATTFWFGFKDDISVRVIVAGTKTVVDVRSLSRVGKGDGGRNADRIIKFLSKVEKLANKKIK